MPCGRLGRWASVRPLAREKICAIRDSQEVTIGSLNGFLCTFIHALHAPPQRLACHAQKKMNLTGVTGVTGVGAIRSQGIRIWHVEARAGLVVHKG